MYFIGGFLVVGNMCAGKLLQFWKCSCIGGDITTI